MATRTLLPPSPLLECLVVAGLLNPLSAVKHVLGTSADAEIVRLTRDRPAITTTLADADTRRVLPDNFSERPVRSLSSLPRGPHGGFLLRPGFYALTLQSYCLHVGTHGPSKGNGYACAPLRGPRETIVRHLLQNSVRHPEVSQLDIQMLLWAILAKTKVRDLYPPQLRQVAKTLLTEREINDLNGGALGWLPPQVLAAASSRLPESAKRALEAENALRQRLTQAGNSFGVLARIAVLGADAPHGSGPTISSGHWSPQPGGFYVRFFPSSFMSTYTQVYMPAIAAADYIPSDGRVSGGAVEFDPSGDVAVPGNPTSQRLALSARPAQGGELGATPDGGAPPSPPSKKPRRKHLPITAKQRRMARDYLSRMHDVIRDAVRQAMNKSLSDKNFSSGQADINRAQLLSDEDWADKFQGGKCAVKEGLRV